MQLAGAWPVGARPTAGGGAGPEHRHRGIGPWHRRWGAGPGLHRRDTTGMATEERPAWPLRRDCSVTQGAQPSTLRGCTQSQPPEHVQRGQWGMTSAALGRVWRSRRGACGAASATVTRERVALAGRSCADSANECEFRKKKQEPDDTEEGHYSLLFI